MIPWEQIGWNRTTLVVEAPFARLSGKEALHAQRALEPRFVDGKVLVGRPAVDTGDDHGESFKIDDCPGTEGKQDLIIKDPLYDSLKSFILLGFRDL